MRDTNICSIHLNYPSTLRPAGEIQRNNNGRLSREGCDD